jgi:DNA-directed RNA polymerase
MKRGVHQLHASGKLFDMTLRRVLGDYTKQQDKSLTSWSPHWGARVKIQVGSELMRLFLKVAEISNVTPDPYNPRKTLEEMVPAVKHEIQFMAGRRWGVLVYHPAMYELVAKYSVSVAPWCLPMIVPPLPWITWTSGGYLQYRAVAVRIHHNMEHRDLINTADRANHLTYCLRTLDILGATPWMINFSVYKVAAHYWNLGIEAPGIPSLHKPPPLPIPDDLETSFASKRAYKKQCAARDRLIRNNFSNRCDVNYKLDIARSFLGETIYFPHNVDFRGRAYPLPPHLNHMGNDLCRGLLKFQERKPLGERGLWWLKVQISNLAGNDKYIC